MPQVSAAMGSHRQFIVYRVEPIADRPGKTNKLPVDYRTGRVCSAHDPAVWLSHAEAEQWAAAYGAGHGVGFVVTEACGLWFLDIDECLEPSGQWSPLATTLCGALSGCAIEVSLSGRGLHVFGSGKLPPHACKNVPLHLELYHADRFVALTGTGLVGDAATVPAPEVLQWLVASFFVAAVDADVNTEWATEPVPEWSGPADDDVLLERMLRAPVSAAAAFGGGVSFRDLWECNAPALARKWPSASGDLFDRSSADGALAAHLAYFTGNNHERMRRLMLRSGLVRDKWTDRPGYVADTVQRMAGRTTKWLADRPAVPAVAAPGVPAGGDGLTFAAAAQGAIPATLTNLIAALQSAEAGTRLAYDAFRDRIMIGQPGAWRLLTDADYVALRREFEARGFKPVSADLMRDSVLYVAMAARIDTAIEWAGGLVWDGTPRVDLFLHRYFGCPDTPYTRAVSRYLWTALAGRALDPGCQADMVPILVGPQGARKTSAIRNMAQALEAFGTVDLLKIEEDDTARKLRGKLVVGLSELRGLKTRDAEAIKDWVTRRVEQWTPKYREFETLFLRRCVLIGDGNRDDLFTDPTGNRRWLPARTGDHIDAEGVARDRDQLWAEGVAMWRQSGIAWQAAETLAKDEHAAFEEVDPWEELADEWLRAAPPIAGFGNVPMPPNGAQPFKLARFMSEALGLRQGLHTGNEARRAGKVLHKLGYDNRVVRVDGVAAKYWINVTPATGCTAGQGLQADAR